jgi:hypothetical protein
MLSMRLLALCDQWQPNCPEDAQLLAIFPTADDFVARIPTIVYFWPPPLTHFGAA